MSAQRCAHHVPPADGPHVYPPPRCSRGATVMVHGFRVGRAVACCNECARRIAAGLAVTTTPIPKPVQHDWRHEDAPIGVLPDLHCARCRLVLTARVDLIDGTPVARLYTPSEALHSGSPWVPSDCHSDAQETP